MASSWDEWLKRLTGGDVKDAAIVGYASGTESVWASTNGLSHITPAEIRMLVGGDRSPLFSGGLTLAGVRCTVLRDTLMAEPQNTMDIKTKASDADPDTYSISIARTSMALLISKGKKETHGGLLNKIVFEVAEKLRSAGY